MKNFRDFLAEQDYSESGLNEDFSVSPLKQEIISNINKDIKKFKEQIISKLQKTNDSVFQSMADSLASTIYYIDNAIHVRNVIENDHTAEDCIKILDRYLKEWSKPSNPNHLGIVYANALIKDIQNKLGKWK